MPKEQKPPDLPFDEIMRRALTIKPDKPKKGSKPAKKKAK